MRIELKITLQNGEEVAFVQPTRKEQNIKELNERNDFPEWARLGMHQCTNCTLSRGKSKWCPAATKIVDMVHAFPQLISYEMVTFERKTEFISYKERIAAQDALVQLLFNTLGYSACPEMYPETWSWEYFSPKYNLKGALFRRLSLELIAKHIGEKKGKSLNRYLDQQTSLVVMLEAIKKRIDNASEIKQDAIQNAIVILHGVISMMKDGYKEFIIDEIERNFVDNK